MEGVRLGGNRTLVVAVWPRGGRERAHESDIADVLDARAVGADLTGSGVPSGDECGQVVVDATSTPFTVSVVL